MRLTVNIFIMNSSRGFFQTSVCKKTTPFYQKRVVRKYKKKILFIVNKLQNDTQMKHVTI